MKKSNNDLLESINRECVRAKQVKTITLLFMFKAQINHYDRDNFLIACFGQGDEAINLTAMQNWVRVQLNTIDESDCSQNEVIEILNIRFNDTLEQLRG